ncbi:hypothetical protein [Streptomyces europaeiscabiei]|uniref:hypothetical protein n=1 Tax=Streptomyces europaeiscabiei TaxID=146819 RepID=UPI002E2832C9|nr:hypothetical protein [Streptomyces europaeiscabiei]
MHFSGEGAAQTLPRQARHGRPTPAGPAVAVGGPGLDALRTQRIVNARPLPTQ